MPRTLTVVMKPCSPDFLARLCNANARGGSNVCPFPECECPLMGGAVPCEDVETWMWEELFEEESDAEKGEDD